MDEHTAPVLILAPSGRDAAVAAAILGEVGVSATVCPDLDALVSDLDRAGGAIVTEEALLHSDRRALATWVRQQPPWSDFPFVLLTSRGSHADTSLTELLGNVTVLERPFHPSVLVNAVRCASRARQRQHEAEAYLLERKQSEEHQALLIRELQHRVKNTLATVQALLRATSRSASTVEDFKQVFEARVLSLSRTHDLLVETSWRSDRTLERRWHLALTAFVGALALIGLIYASGNIVLSFILLTLASLGIITTMPLFWSIPTGYLKGAAAAGGIAFINSLGLTGGFVSPFVLGWIKTSTGSLGP